MARLAVIIVIVLLIVFYIGLTSNNDLLVFAAIGGIGICLLPTIAPIVGGVPKVYEYGDPTVAKLYHSDKSNLNQFPPIFNPTSNDDYITQIAYLRKNMSHRDSSMYGPDDWDRERQRYIKRYLAHIVEYPSKDKGRIDDIKYHTMLPEFITTLRAITAQLYQKNYNLTSISGDRLPTVYTYTPEEQEQIKIIDEWVHKYPFNSAFGRHNPYLPYFPAYDGKFGPMFDPPHPSYYPGTDTAAEYAQEISDLSSSPKYTDTASRAAYIQAELATICDFKARLNAAGANIDVCSVPKKGFFKRLFGL